MTIEQFKKLIEEHDLTYEMSDDDRYYRAGRQSLAIIKFESKQFEPDLVIQIWNEQVAKKLVDGYRKQFEITIDDVMSWRKQ
jgi:hypothetical protein